MVDPSRPKQGTNAECDWRKEARINLVGQLQWDRMRSNGVGRINKASSISKHTFMFHCESSGW